MTSEPNRGGHSAAGKPEGVHSAWDHSTHQEFYDYYAKESVSREALQRFTSIRDTILRALAKTQNPARSYDVADIGCGAGTPCLLWADLGHRAHGLDVNGPLVDLGRQRAAKAGYAIDFRVGSAVQLPWPSESMDICLVLELLEHVAEWKACLKEAIRILRPGGALFLSTTNHLCPRQEEFNLPFYSWYPTRLKHHFEKLAVTTRPELANYAKYPAVNWFSFYRLRDQLSQEGFHSLDRFDLMDISTKSALPRMTVRSVRAVPVLRWLAHVATPGTMLLAIKRTEP
jgi:2-polyprenyl-6-hydroxyphenyl methylase/3-demethylubiquinone-9 3-methyltransferase